ESSNLDQDATVVRFARSGGEQRNYAASPIRQFHSWLARSLISGVAGCRRSRDREGPESNIYGEGGRSCYGVAAGGRRTGKIGRYAGPQITVLSVGDGCCRIRAYRGFDGRTARTVFNGKVEASNQIKSKTKAYRAKDQQDEHWCDDCKFDGRRTIHVSE